METWFIILISIFVAALLKAFIINLLFTSKNNKLPPGPFTFPVIGTLPWLVKSPLEVEQILRKLHAKFGPIVTIPSGHCPAIFIADRALAHKALVQNGAVFADRPPALPVLKTITKDQRNISTGFYGPTWRLFRRNLTSEILHPSRAGTYKRARKWVLAVLLDRLKSESTRGGGDDHPIPVSVNDHLQYAMFCLLVLMCFGDKLDHDQIKLIENVQRRRLQAFARFRLLDFCPTLTKIFLRKKWEELFRSLKDQENTLFPLIRARKKAREEWLSKKANHQQHADEEEYVLSYVDTLFDLRLPDHENRKLNEEEIYTLCSEFLTAGTDTTSAALQWIMANMVKYPRVQEKLYMEIKGVVGNGEEEDEVKEEKLQNIPYLKAVVLEGLRRHPPGHFLLPHAVTEDFTLDGYLIPKNATINFMVAEMGLDPKVWEDPMAFQPERFLSAENGRVEDFDITGSKEIKMMPFGAGRRICPGLGFSMLHLEYFVANLVWCFEWKAVDGDEIDFSEKQELSTMMKNPLRARISPRIRCNKVDVL
ncbi:hypothetical protein AB3S75_035280 [Citrus x aurantiifolia]